MSEAQRPAEPGGAEQDLSAVRLGDYHLLRRLGRGGMAEVYLAEQESLHRQVAVKVLKRALAGDESYVRRFLHEAQAAASLVHANIVQIHEVGCIDGIHFIAQEYVDGPNIRQILDRQGAMSVPAAVNVMRQVAAALHKAGQQRITHRDIKPENIMLSSGGEVKVADFGLARVEREGVSLNLTQIGMTMGTPLYMSPEQVEGRSVDTRSDLYSFGVTCYHMLAGRPPFSGESPLTIAVQHLNTEPRRLQELRNDLPEGLCRIVHKLMAKRPQDRYQSAAELLYDLKSLQIDGLDPNWAAGFEGWTDAEFQAGTSSRFQATQQLATAMREAAGAAPRRLRRAAAAAGLLLACLAGAALGWATRPASPLRVDRAALPEIQRQATVREQYFHAAQIATEQAWQSVAEYFPPEESEQNRYYALRATQRLAELYRQNDDLDRAFRCYSELAQADVGDDLRAAGLAGQANLCLLRGDPAQAQRKLLDLAQIYDRLNPALKQMLMMEVDVRLRPELSRLTREVPPSNG